jgi:hypothetical protein
VFAPPHLHESSVYTPGMPIVSPASIAMGRTLIPWVLASTACYGLATTLLAIFWRHINPHNRLATLANSAGGAATGWLVWVIWLIGPGYVALIMGLLSPRLMGLSQIDLGTGLGLGALFAAFSVGVLLAAGLTYRRTRHTGSPYASLGQAVGASVRLVLESGALQWHWAFYRSAIIAAAAGMGLSSPVYWGAWLAVGWICLEGALSPFLWHDLRTPGAAEIRMLRGVLLFATTVVYLLSRNFWLTWALHAVAIVILEPRLSGPSGYLNGNKKGPWQQNRRQQPF